MAKAKHDISNEAVERGLKAIADERVMPPAGFRRDILRRLAAETGQVTPRESLVGRLRRWYANPAFAPALGGAAVLAIVAFVFAGQQKTQPTPQIASIDSGAIESQSEKNIVQKTVVGQANALQQESTSSAQALVASRNKEKLFQPVDKNSQPEIQQKQLAVSLERGLAPMPLRQPRSLQSLQSDRPAIQRTKPVVIAHSNSPEQLPRANTTRVVTAVPTPMAPVKGFSEVRRNVFKPGQGEFVAIMIKLDAAEHVEVSVFNMNGRKVISLLDETRNPGVHEVRWSGYNSHGDASATGKYLVVVKSLKKLERHKVALIR